MFGPGPVTARAVRTGPFMSRKIIDLGLRYLQQGDYDRAEQTLRGLIRESRRNANAWCILGLVSQARGKLQEAAAQYQEAAKLDPRYPDPLNNLGWVYNTLRQPDKAIAPLQKALRIAPDYPEALNNLGNAYSMQGKFEQAATCYRKALKVRPAYAEAMNNLAQVCIAQGQIEEARRWLAEALP